MNGPKIIEVLDRAIRKAHGEGWDYVDLSIEDAREILVALKRCEPRMMTKSEAEQYTNGEEKYEYSDKPPLFIEHKKAQPFYIKWATLEVVYAWMKDLNMKQEYGKTFRFWTSRPTPEQMWETKWEGEDAE